jgi:DNA-binding winged helix-turn-helix (wHTH) protein
MPGRSDDVRSWAAERTCGYEASISKNDRPTAELAVGLPFFRTAHECSITTQCLRSPAGRIESWRRAARIAPRQKSKSLLDISNPSKRRSTDHEIIAPSFWEYPSRTVTHRSERMCHLHRKGNAAQHCQPGRKHGMQRNFVDRMLRSSLPSNDLWKKLRRAASFGPFCLLPARQVLLEGETPVRLGSRALEILIVLVKRAGKLVTKGELMACVWPDTVVESSLRFHLARLQRALNQGREGERRVTNVLGRGYCFVAPVSRATSPCIQHPYG